MERGPTPRSPGQSRPALLPGDPLPRDQLPAPQHTRPDCLRCGATTRWPRIIQRETPDASPRSWDRPRSRRHPARSHPRPPPDPATALRLVRHSLGLAHLPARPPALPRLRTRTPPRASPRHRTRPPSPGTQPLGRRTPPRRRTALTTSQFSVPPPSPTTSPGQPLHTHPTGKGPMVRCPATLPRDHTPCAGPAAVTVLDASNAGADGCEHHAARLLPVLDRGRVCALPHAPAGGAHRVFNAAAPQDVRLNGLADAAGTPPATPC